MCNRYRLKARPDELIDMFDLSRDMMQLRPIAAEFYPGRRVHVVYLGRSRARELVEMTWGFPPFKGTKPINNTRSEQAGTSPFWSRHLSHRCVFPLSEAVEWQHRLDTTTGEVRKVPHTLAFRDGRIGVVAGIYRETGDGLCCSMTTCRANKLWSTIHNAKPEDPRMVCFLPDKQAIAAWLDPDRSYESLKELLSPLPDEPDLLIATPATGGGRGGQTRPWGRGRRQSLCVISLDRPERSRIAGGKANTRRSPVFAREPGD